MIWLHRWAGISLAIFAIVSALTGGLLLWSDEYQRVRYSELAFAKNDIAPSANAIEALVAASPGPIGTIGMPRETLPGYQTYLLDGTQALHDAASGKLIAHWSKWETLPSLLFEAHVRLFAGETGHTIVGGVGLLLLLMLVTGIWIWWPRRKRFRASAWWPANTRNAALMKAHAAQGISVFAILAFLFFSGAAIVFHEPAQNALNALLGSAAKTRPATVFVEGAVKTVDWRRILPSAKAAFPVAELRFATLPRNDGEPLILRLKQTSELHPNGRSYLVLHPQTGEVIERIDATQIGAGPAVFNALYPLHSGKTAWRGHRLLLLACSMSLVYLATSGALVFLRRRRTLTDAGKRA